MGMDGYCREVWSDPAPRCVPCGPSDIDPATGQFAPECKHLTLADCQKKCHRPVPITPGHGKCGTAGNAGSAGSRGWGGGAACGGEGSCGSSGGSSSASSVPSQAIAQGGYGFRPSGGMPVKCACDAGYIWARQGEHSCGCNSESREVEATSSARRSGVIGASGSVIAPGGVAVALGRSSELVSGADRNKGCGDSCCCCIDGMKIVWEKPVVTGWGPFTYFGQPFRVEIKYRMLGVSGTRLVSCDYAWWEASRSHPHGFPQWNDSGWNAAHDVERFDAHYAKQHWLREQKLACNEGAAGKERRAIGYDTPSMPSIHYRLGITTQALIFVKAESGCSAETDEGCQDWCAILRVVFGTPTPIIDVIGPFAGDCDMPSLNMASDGLVSVPATWARLVGSLGLQPWRMGGGRYF